MAQFEGETVIMTLHQPPNTIVEGRVRKINVGSNNPSIELENVYFPGTGTRWESWIAHSSNIANLDLAPQKRTPNETMPTMQQGPGGQQPQMQRMPSTHAMPMQQQHPSQQQHGGQQYQQHSQQYHPASQMPMHMQRPPGLGFTPPMPMHAPTHSLERPTSTSSQQQRPAPMPSAQGPPLPGKQVPCSAEDHDANRRRRLTCDSREECFGEGR
jgi:hypothetical protein